MSAIEIHRVRAFVGAEALGNPAGVVMTEQQLTDSQMAKLAILVGAPETAFLVNQPNPSDWIPIRYFSMSGTEVDFCGHATISAAAVRRQMGLKRPAKFQPAKSPRVTVKATTIENGRWFILSRKIIPGAIVDALDDCTALVDLGIPDVLSTYRSPDGDLLVKVADAAFIHAYRPDGAALERSGLTRLVLMAVAEPADGMVGKILLRYFAPGLGIPEDPATGAVALLVAEWLKPKWSQRTIFQASQDAAGNPIGGHLRIGYDHASDHVFVRGQCVIETPLWVEFDGDTPCIVDAPST